MFWENNNIAGCPVLPQYKENSKKYAFTVDFQKHSNYISNTLPKTKKYLSYNATLRFTIEARIF